MRSFERSAFVLLLFVSFAALAVAIMGVAVGHPTAGKWLASAGLIATITGLFQLQVSELIEKILDKYSDDERYPGGPPSYITRQIIANPDKPFATSARDMLFFNPKTGVWIIITGTLIQVFRALGLAHERI